jgi:hypothetical protein
MKNILLKVWNHVKQNYSAIFWSLWVGFAVYNIGNLLVKVNNNQEAKLQAARQETADFRDKINNHLIAEGFYNKPAKEVLPVMKEFGIGL